MSFSFEEMIAPMPFQRFVAEYLGKQPLYCDGRGRDPIPVIDYDELNDVLTRTAITPGMTHLLHPGHEIPPDKYLWVPFKDGEKKLFRPEVLENELAAGATLHMRGCENVFPRVHSLTESLVTAFHARVSANLFLVYHPSKPSGVHWDDHDMIVCQLAGRKRWPIYKPTCDHPVYDPHRRYPEKIEKVAEHTLLPGDVLYVPRAWPHNPEGIDGRSLHLACAILAPTGVNLLENVLADLRRTASCIREDLPLHLDKSARTVYAERIRQAVLAALSDRELERYYMRHELSVSSRNVRLPRLAECASSIATDA